MFDSGLSTEQLIASTQEFFGLAGEVIFLLTAFMGSWYIFRAILFIVLPPNEWAMGAQVQPKLPILMRALSGSIMLNIAYAIKLMQNTFDLDSIGTSTGLAINERMLSSINGSSQNVSDLQFLLMQNIVFGFLMATGAWAVYSSYRDLGRVADPQAEAKGITINSVIVRAATGFFLWNSYSVATWFNLG